MYNTEAKIEVMTGWVTTCDGIRMTCEEYLEMRRSEQD